jgi:hypothetical protein
MSDGTIGVRILNLWVFEVTILIDWDQEVFYLT